MSVEDVRAAYQTAVNNIASSIAEYAVNSETDFSRTRKLPTTRVLQFLVTKGNGSTKNELWDLTGSQEDPPSSQALVQQRAKLKAEGVQALLYEFNNQTKAMTGGRSTSPYRFLAVDGSTFIFPSDRRYAGKEYYCQSQPGQRGTYSMHLTALYDLDRCCYADGTIQPLRMADERAALCHLCDAYKPLTEDELPVFVADRGFESYNVFGHLQERGWHFVIRCQEINIRRWVHDITLPDDSDWDEIITIDLTRSKSKQVKSSASIVRVLSSSTQFDFLERGSKDVYCLTLRVVRFPLDDSGKSWEYLVTNLPADEFPSDQLKAVYAQRWEEEGSFRDLKYPDFFTVFSVELGNCDYKAKSKLDIVPYLMYFTENYM